MAGVMNKYNRVLEYLQNEVYKDIHRDDMFTVEKDLIITVIKSVRCYHVTDAMEDLSLENLKCIEDGEGYSIYDIYKASILSRKHSTIAKGSEISVLNFNINLAGLDSIGDAIIEIYAKVMVHPVDNSEKPMIVPLKLYADKASAFDKMYTNLVNKGTIGLLAKSKFIRSADSVLFDRIK